MSVIQVNQIKSRIETIYKELIDLSDVKKNKENYFLSRAFAAYSLQVLADIEPDIAAKSIVDSYNDNGIDALFYNPKTSELWIIQSKWIKKGVGEPEVGDTNKFTKGIKDLIELKFDRFNDKVKNKIPDIEAALDDLKIKIRIVIAYTGSDTLSEHNQRIIDDLLEEVNEASQLMEFSKFSLKQGIKALINLLDGQPINIDIVLQSWGKIETPYSAFYGTIDGATLAQLWDTHKTRLLSDNIREFIGNTSVNSDIKDTALRMPEHFFYFNNGITALCDNITKKAIGGANHSVGQFTIENIKIVNGAQTVGSLGEAFKINPDAVEKASVFLKIISLQDCPANFGQDVTQKTNTQNKIEKRDFVSLDPQHERLQTELALENITYQIKRSQDKLPPDTSCNVEEVITAVACSLKEIDNTVLAKREVGKLWDNISQPLYINIINENLTGTKAWRCVQIMRRISSIIKNKETTITGREKGCYIHSNRFILHLVLVNIEQQILLDPKYNFKNFLDEHLDDIIIKYETETYQKVEQLYSTSLMHQLFRNYTKCRELEAKLEI